MVANTAYVEWFGVAPEEMRGHPASTSAVCGFFVLVTDATARVEAQQALAEAQTRTGARRSTPAGKVGKAENRRPESLRFSFSG